tara:strand:- start:944 stop:1678 length:735 start_codon:yes stop_codon:yes gene_type:complete
MYKMYDVYQKQGVTMLPPLCLPVGVAKKRGIHELEENRRVKWGKDPRSMFIDKYCVQVPWELYEMKKVYDEDKDEERLLPGQYRHMKTFPLIYLLDDVITDYRLDDDLKRSLGMSNERSVTKWERVQRHVNESQGTPMSTVWVMQFVVMDHIDEETGDHINFGRMCLVPEESTDPLTRLKDALEHLNTMATETRMYASLRNPKALYDASEPPKVFVLNPDLVEWKKSWVRILEMAIEKTAAVMA